MTTKIHTETVTYYCGETPLKGFFAIPITDNKPPVILVTHAWKGQDEFSRKKAVSLAGLGYAAFAVDLYGNGATAQTNEEASTLMMPLFLDRLLLKNRMLAAYEKVSADQRFDRERIGAIGFCFGGLGAIELFKSGAFVSGVVAFHPILGNKLGDAKAKTTNFSNETNGKLLVFLGYNDPMVPLSDRICFQEELDRQKVDWQMVTYGNTAHAFTNPEAQEANIGLMYDTTSDKRSWKTMCDFFKETFI